MEPRTDQRLWTRKPDRPRAAHVSGTLFDWIMLTIGQRHDAARQRIESAWLGAPESMRKEFRSRLQSSRESDLYSAFCELWYRDVLATHGFECLDPANNQSGSNPDWLLTIAERPVAVAECYVRTESDADTRVDRIRRRWFADTRSKMTDKALQLDVEKIVAGAGQPSAAHFAKHLDEIGQTVPEPDPDTGWSSGPEQVYEHEPSGWAVHYTPSRIRYSTDNPSRALVAVETTADHVDGVTPFAQAIARKSRQHDWSLPVVLCFHWNDWFHEPDAEEVRRVVAERSASMQAKGVYALLWAPGVYPWGSDLVGGPTLLHWNAPELAPFLDVWSGATEDVSPSITN